MSECVRATSKDLLGPYEFAEVVLQKRPDNWDNSRVHNVKIVKAGEKFVLYYINSANQTGYAVADAVTGPWKRVGQGGHESQQPGDSRSPGQQHLRLRPAEGR
jgi:hypothetical protein